jgi:hypothetical protein
MYEVRQYAGLKHTPTLGTLDVSSTSNETARITVPSGLTVALIQAQGLTQTIGPAEAWLCVGFWYTIGTTIATGTPVVSLAKGGTAVTGADATLPLATNGTTYLWASFANYTRPTIAAADTMSLKPTTTNSATGVITPYLGYIPIAVVGVSDGVTTV